MLHTFLQQFVIALTVGSTYALIALGYTMVYGVLRLINFAHSDVFMLGAYVGAYTGRAFVGSGQQSLLQAFLGIAVAAAVCSVVGWGIERFAYRPLRNTSKLSVLITAIGVSLLLENLANIPWWIGGKTWFGPTPTPYPTIAGSNAEIGFITRIFGVSVLRTDVMVIAATAAVLALLWYIVRFTRRGQAMRAVSQSYDAAKLMGINLDGIISFTFILGSAMAAIGGCLSCLHDPQVTPDLGVNIGLKAFVAAVIGGIGNIPGAAAGGLLLGLLETSVIAFGYAGYEGAITYGLLILMLMARPEGIFGKALPEKV